MIIAVLILAACIIGSCAALYAWLGRPLGVPADGVKTGPAVATPPDDFNTGAMNYISHEYYAGTAITTIAGQHGVATCTARVNDTIVCERPI